MEKAWVGRKGGIEGKLLLYAEYYERGSSKRIVMLFADPTPFVEVGIKKKGN